MNDAIEERLAQLENTEEGWVTRRDAAEALGQVAAKALEALRSHAEEKDVDVRAMAVKALGWSKGSLEGVSPVAQERPFSLEELAESVEKPGGREVTTKGDGYEITVTLSEGRTQKVLAELATSHGGRDTIRISTQCGPGEEKALRWALRTNNNLSHCSLSLAGKRDKERLIMTHSFLADSVTPKEFKTTVKEIAFYGDWAESKLTDGDEF